MFLQEPPLRLEEELGCLEFVYRGDNVLGCLEFECPNLEAQTLCPGLVCCHLRAL